MTQAIHIPHERPSVTVLEESSRGGLRYRLMIDADHGPSSDVVQGFFHFDGGHAETRHAHDRSETAHVVSGTGRVTLGDREIAVRTGDTVFIPAGMQHGFVADDDMALFFTFPGDRFAEVTFDREESA